MIKKANDLMRDKSECCGCSACQQACPKHAISMEPDEMGFLFPVIDEKKCIGCNKCTLVCDFKNRIRKELEINPESYWAVNKDQMMLKRSASGGIFSAVAKYILNEGGVVFGAALLCEYDQVIIKHIMIDRFEQICLLQGSKYVQSNIANSYLNVKQQLDKGKKVLFCGTPCQIGGLKGFLNNKEYENLYTIDLICHGVPSEKVFHDYIETLERKVRGKVIDFEFRNKDFGWGLLAKVNFRKKNGKKIYKYYLPIESSYYKMFLEGLIYRSSCYNCKYTTNSRVGDITVGDYWGIDNGNSELTVNTKNGVSCLLINTEKGTNIIKDSGLEYHSVDYNDIKKENHQLYTSVPYPKVRDDFSKYYKKRGYKVIDCYYRKHWRTDRWIMKAKRMIPTIVKDGVKNILKSV